MLDISLTRVTDFYNVGRQWQDLELRADISFFQSWAWTGCLAEERFSDPVLLAVRINHRIVGLGLFNHRPRFFGRSTLWLGESGDPCHDDVFLEHNGLLIDRDQPQDMLGAWLTAAQNNPLDLKDHPRPRNIVLSGVHAGYITASASNHLSLVRVRASREAPFVDLEVVRKSQQDFLATLSANTRYQIRRSERRYAEFGPVAIQRAQSLDEAQDYLSCLIALHQDYWTRRAKRGAFANPQFERFHRTLIERAFVAGGTDLLKVTAGSKVIGYLYNLSLNGHVCAYQSGFNYQLSHSHQRPGLTCHHLAIEMYLAEGCSRYDFLAGSDRYKLSFSNATASLYWIRVGRHSWYRWQFRHFSGRNAAPFTN
jgi:CelD/BcsL family acetyltransferase involved in cellulose biosynthesis